MDHKEFSKKGGSAKSEKKTAACRKNARRPRKKEMPETEHKSIWSCDINASKIIFAGTKIKLPYVWAHTDQGITSSKDIEIILDQDMPLHEALFQVEQAALAFVKSEGASDIRQYFIEGVYIGEEMIEFVIGT